MANHGYVKTKQVMAPEATTSLIKKLNDTVFHNCLKIEYVEGGKPGDWGKHIWFITALMDDGSEIGHRVCWLNNSKSFEMRHGGGGNFIWWIDQYISNEIALQFNGTISDDGCGDKEKPKNKFHKWRKYNKILCGWGNRKYIKNFDAKKWIPNKWISMQLHEERVPNAFKSKNWRFVLKEIENGFELVPTGKV